MLCLLAIMVTSVLCISVANATISDLNISVAAQYSEISPGTDQDLTATTNEVGLGILFVLQPATGQPWETFLNDHPTLKAACNSLSADVKDDVEVAIGDKVVSFAIVSMGPGSKVYTFPDDFEGINGEANTYLPGNYKVFFAFASLQIEFKQLQTRMRLRF